MTSYFGFYTTRCAKLFEQRHTGKRSFRLFRFGLLPHEIAALNAR